MSIEDKGIWGAVVVGTYDAEFVAVSTEYENHIRLPRQVHGVVAVGVVQDVV